ncbi:hypothetical protein QN277_017916 [Acacia crassicarpa]|uniref:Cytochrome b6-f complex subunit 7 n=1 Tax=Acacia crassicarpa TaxID=499986 RepID=A0AAE1MUD7_9FABA|nr:hypothetical protein QN277_017916 [Acacia crassicarpa]
MAMASATLSLPSLTACSATKTHRRMKTKVSVGGFNSFNGLKAHNNIVSLGLPLSADQCFAKMVNSMRVATLSGKGKGKRGGGAFSATCNAAGEIFRIAAIMNGLVLVGVAVGFVLLRIEAWVEESEA